MFRKKVKLDLDASAADPSGRAVYDRSLAGIAGSNPAGANGCLSLVSVVR